MISEVTDDNEIKIILFNHACIILDFCHDDKLLFFSVFCP